ncbi:MAG: thiamine phosphate synthase, partial [Acidobacteria bacterium]|nr:thiamine phosphate synthase [Acidobacteriota bacterium]
LREDSFPASRARTLVPTGFLIGQSVHDPEHSCLCGAVADYVIVGTVFRSRSKDVTPTGGPERVAEVVGKSSVPVLAIGGISVDTLALLRGTGAAGFAAIDFFLGPEGTEDEELPEVVEGLVVRARQLFDTAPGDSSKVPKL